MLYNNFFYFQDILQEMLCMLWEVSNIIFLSVKFVTTHFCTFIYSFPWHLCFKIIESLVTFIASCIAIYAFLLRYVPYFRKVEFYTTEFKRDLYKGTQLFVVLENKSLASFALKEITLVINDINYIIIQHFDNPFILKPFETAKIGTGYIHSIVDHKGEVLTPKNLQGKQGLLLKLYAKKEKDQTILINTKNESTNSQYITLSKASFKGVPYSISVIYAIQYYLVDTSYLIFVDKSGLCSRTIGLCNQIPKEHLAKADLLKKYLEKESKHWFGTKVKFFITPLNEPLEKLPGVKNVTNKRTRP